MRKSTEYILVACAVITTIFVCTFIGNRLISNHTEKQYSGANREANRVALQKPKPDPEQIITLFFSLLKDLASEDKPVLDSDRGKTEKDNLLKQQ